jgi:hypothetical protein
MTAYWKTYRENCEANLALKRADAAAGIRRCADPSCNEPVAAPRRANLTSSKQLYCVLHAGADEERKRRRYEADRRARKAASRVRAEAVLERLGDGP